MVKTISQLYAISAGEECQGEEKVEQDKGSWEYGVGCNFDYKPHIEGDF